MASLTDYIKLPLEHRQQHLQPDAPCSGTDRISKKRLLSALGIDDNCPNWLQAKVTIGYTCPCGCGNPAHAFICRPDERRSEQSRRIRERLAPYARSKLSDRQVAKLTSTSAATVAKYRRQMGDSSGIRLGKDGKLYARGSEAKALKELQQALKTASQLLTPQRITPEVRQLLAAISAQAQEAAK